MNFRCVFIKFSSFKWMQRSFMYTYVRNVSGGQTTPILFYYSNEKSVTFLDFVLTHESSTHTQPFYLATCKENLGVVQFIYLLLLVYFSFVYIFVRSILLFFFLFVDSKPNIISMKILLETATRTLSCKLFSVDTFQ